MKSQGNGKASLRRTPCRHRTKTESAKTQNFSSLEYIQFLRKYFPTARANWIWYPTIVYRL